MNVSFFHMLQGMMIQLERPTIRRKEMSAVLQTMVDEHIGIGENTRSFSSLLKGYLTYASQVVSLRTQMDALIWALRSLQLEQGSHVGVSPLAPSWYAHAVHSLGLKLRILDIDQQTLSIDEALLSSQSSTLGALILHEPHGLQCPESLYHCTDLPVIADISQSFGTLRGGEPAGAGATAVIMGFEHSDIVSSGGGAALAFRDDRYYSKIEEELMLLYPFIALGDLNSALGMIQMAQMEESVIRREAIAQRFFLASQRNRHRAYSAGSEEYRRNGFSFILTLEGTYEEAEEFALKHGILTSRAFDSVLLEEVADPLTHVPRAAAVRSRTMRFPVYPFLSEKEIVQIERVIAHIP